ncbi:PTS N-acetylglucosamine transporter subunit IIBC [Lactobacillus sp. ESL0681]|uniref:PTS sugar transporter subunit IIA n=1 Tax=Lactobacillus sp. ESL0681 TaxID=2983211 RepID=UPI0023F9CF3B|nr:PTS N-acetylglucosamine transporter subunit IIBC [Lactobacillus sp. ESL0681]WEV40150.1 PTS N-acetylglucosamine transporter subunit IIBC [Lactobacillus sp. ESL0681]
MSEYIIATHSYLAEGYHKSISFFNDALTNVHYINAYVDGQKTFTDQLKEKIIDLKGNQIIILTDLPGGSVNKEALALIKKFDCKVISGINLSLVLELVMSGKESLTDKEINAAVKQSRQQIVYINDLLKEDDLDD